MPVDLDVKVDKASGPGYRTVGDLSARHLLQVDACTKCGKCHEACPARATERPLSPRDVVLELREQANEFLRPGPGDVLRSLLRRSGERPEPGELITDGVIGEEAIWSCTQCNACVEICPVGIEQAPLINMLRQAQVDEGRIEPQLQTKFETIREVGNSFGSSEAARADWTKQVGDIKITDAREEEVDVLWFVGDHAAFDPQAQKVAISLARVLTSAGVRFGILYDGERNSGNDVRGAGEVGLFQQLVRHNVEAISKCRFNRVMTSDPHSFNALRNAYPDFGGRWTVLHHTQLLLELIESGQLDVADTLDHRVTYHDPCFLGRHNGVYDPPRQILERLGCTLVEMPRNRENSFCCGAGGGRIWMKDPAGVERPADNRIREAAALDVELYVVACPKDVIMYEAAIEDTGHSGDLRLRELTQLIEEAVALRHAARSRAS